MTGPADPGAPRGVSAPGGPGRGDTGAHPFGRERESGAVDAVLDCADGPRMVVVVGERGAGRTVFTRDLVRRQRAAGTAALAVECMPGDAARPLLLALRLVRALEQRVPEEVRQRRPVSPVTGMLAAIEHGDRAAAADALTAALAQSAVTVVVVEDAQYGDHESLGMLDALDLDLAAPRVRFVISVLEPAATAGQCSAATARMEQMAGRQAVHVVQLAPLTRQEVAALLARRLRAAPDGELAGRVHRLTRGVPAAVDALLAEWVRQDAVRTVGGHALLAAEAAVPVLPAGDRFVTALYVLGEPAVAVASALSVLWPLGAAAPRLAAAVTGLPADAVRSGLRELAAAGVVEELPEAGGGVRGWTFRLPLVEHTVRERLGPLDRGNLAKAAVQELWAAGAEPGRPGAALLPEADAATYLPDRIADAGALLDRERAVAQLTAAADRAGRRSGHREVLRWVRAAGHLTEDPAARDRLSLRYVARAVAAREYATARKMAEALLRSRVRTGGLTAAMYQDLVALLVEAAAAEGDRPGLSRMAGELWWALLDAPAVTRVSGRAMALCALGRWPEVAALLERTERQWSGTAAVAVPLALCRGIAEAALGRPERFRRSLAPAAADGLSGRARHAMTVVQANQLLALAEVRAAGDLLAARQVALADLPVYTRFLWHHLEGGWGQALELARRLFADRRPGTTGLGQRLFPGRATSMLIARGRVSTAVRLIGTVREEAGGATEYEHLLCLTEAEAARVLGDPVEAARALRCGLEAARARGEVFGTDELWAELAAVHAEAGELPSARDCLGNLERIAEQTGSERARLLWLLGAARLPAAAGDPADSARGHLRDAVALARRRGQPFETAVALLAAAGQDEDPARPLLEAYELFFGVGAPLWRFRTRARMRQAGVPVPGRGQATAENEQLLATLVSDGLTNRQVAAALGLSPDAVANRLTRLFARTGARSRTELVAAVVRGSAAPADW